MSDTIQTLRVFSLKTYCDRAGHRHAMHSLYTMAKSEVMSKHPQTGKNLIKMGVLMREEDYDPGVDPKVMRDEDSLEE